MKTMTMPCQAHTPILCEHSPGGGIFGALDKATNMLHWTMRLTPYQPGGMVITFAIDFN
jgi:hypothetical protein